MGRTITILSVTIAAISPAVAQGLDGCEKGLIQNVAQIRQNDLVTLRTSQLLVDKQAKSESKDFFGAYGGGIASFESFEQSTRDAFQKNNLDYSHDKTLSMLFYYLPPGASQSWIQCKEIEKSRSLFIAQPQRGSTPDKAQLILTWRPGEDLAAMDGGAPGFSILGHTVPGLTIDTNKVINGSMGFEVKRSDPSKPIEGVINGKIERGRSISVNVYIPGQTTVEMPYFVSTDDITRCDVRQGTQASNCWRDDMKALNFSPPGDNRTGVLTLKIPPGATHFRSALTTSSCKDAVTLAAWNITVNGKDKGPKGPYPKGSYPENLNLDVELNDVPFGSILELSGTATGRAGNAVGSDRCTDLWAMQPRFERRITVDFRQEVTR